MASYDEDELANFLRGTFHQDFRDELERAGEAPDAERALHRAIAELNATQRAALAKDVRALLAANPDEDRVDAIVGDEMGVAYYPPGDGLTTRAWLHSVAIALETDESAPAAQ